MTGRHEPRQPADRLCVRRGACLLVYVGLRREKSALHGYLLAVLSALLLWTAAPPTRCACFSRLPTEDRGPVDLNEVTLAAIRLATLHENRGVEIETRLARQLPPVTGPSERLGQVLLNLLVNAKQALARVPAGRIPVETRVVGGDACATVHDGGPGIPVEIQDRVFDPFFTTKGPDEGTGLGLSIAFDSVRDHGGVLEVDSRPGEGTRFSVRLPIPRS